MQVTRRRVALVTGGTRGIGREIVRLFAARGFSVAFCYRSAVKDAESLVAELLSAEVNCLAVKCDVSDYAQVIKMRDELERTFGFIDTVVNNAGVADLKLFTDTDTADFDNVIGVNLKGAYNVCRAFAPKMIEWQSGKIINISSIWGLRGAACEALYSTSKAGIIGLTKALAKELAPSGITVNAVAPGMIQTQMNDCYTDKEIQDFLQTVPLKRIGEAKEIASAVYFLATNNYITGEVLNVSGGL